jgi:hypothetical protein
MAFSFQVSNAHGAALDRLARVGLSEFDLSAFAATA